MPKFNVGDKAWLPGMHIKSQHPNKKLDHKQYGLFPVTEIIVSHMYWLALPNTMKIHDVFHANLLTPVKEDEEFQCNFAPPPPVIAEEGEEQYRVGNSWIGRPKMEFGGTGSGAKDMSREYTTEFRNLMADLDWDDTTLLATYQVKNHFFVTLSSFCSASSL
jgi:hypothetical protein